MSSGAAGWDLEPGGAGGSHRGHFYLPGDDDESLASGEDEGMMLEESSGSTRWTDFAEISRQRKPSYGSSVPQRKSQTLPHWRSPRGGLMVPSRHIRSLSESKQTTGDWVPESASDAADILRNRDMQHLPAIAPRTDETKSRSNSCTDSSGVSSCDSGLGKHTTSERIQTLSPIPSSTSLNTLKSAGINRRSSVTSGRKYSVQGSVTSDGAPSSPDTRISQQDLAGYATLRSLHRYRRPVYSDSSSVAAEELLGFEDPCAGVQTRTAERHPSTPIMCEFEAPMPPQLFGGGSAASLATRIYYGSRSNIGVHQGTPPGSELSQQCYMGISMPRQLSAIFPLDGQGGQPVQSAPSRRRGSTSFSEMEQVQEVGEETESTSSSESDEADNLLKPQPSGFAADNYKHSVASCLSCCRLRDRKISTSSYHRYRTDTESSCGGGESPILYPRRRKSHSTSSYGLGATPGGSVDSGNSLDVGSSQQDDAVPSKSIIRREIMKHVSRMSNPVWNKVSKQALLQLKQKHASVFQDVCLYSAVCHRMASSTYRLTARRFIQELFLDLNFDVLYEEPINILQMHQQPPPPAPTDACNKADDAGGGSGVKLSTGTISALSMKLAQTTVAVDICDITGKDTCTNSVLASDTQPSVSASVVLARTNVSDPVPIAAGVPSAHSVRSPPLEIVKEETYVSVSSLEQFSSTESISNTSNEQMAEGEVAFFNLQFDDIPMIDDTGRVSSDSRTPDSPVVSRQYPLGAINKALVTAESRCHRNKVTAITQITKPSVVAGNNGVLVNSGCAEKTVQESAVSVEMQKAVTVHYQENSLHLQPSSNDVSIKASKEGEGISTVNLSIQSQASGTGSSLSKGVRHRKMATTAAPNISEVNVPLAKKDVPAASHQSR